MKIILQWKIYIRCSNEWHIPCKECQKKFTKAWENELKSETNKYSYDLVHQLAYNDSPIVRGILIKNLCKNCLTKIKKILTTKPLILGNKDYDPAIEISRS